MFLKKNQVLCTWTTASSFSSSSSSSFSNLTIGLQKLWDRVRPRCHHRLHLTLWRPCPHKHHNLHQKHPATPRRRKIPQKKGKPHQPQKQRSQVSLFISFLVLLIISGLTCLRCLFPSRLSRQWQTNRYFFCNLIVCFCWQNKFFLIFENSARSSVQNFLKSWQTNKQMAIKLRI